MDEPPQGGWSPAHDAALTADVLLLRHGETRLTPEQRFSGVAGEDPGLSPRGRTQAQLAAASTLLRQKPFTHILSSPLTRCRETADILASEMGSPVTVDENLREMDFGQWEGMTYAEVEQRFPTDLAQWQRSPDVAPTGSGETFSAVLHRAALVADHFASSYAGASVIAVTHVTPVKALVATPSAHHHWRCSPSNCLPPASRASPTPAAQHWCG